jgi:hypothetical protein
MKTILEIGGDSSRNTQELPHLDHLEIRRVVRRKEWTPATISDVELAFCNVLQFAAERAQEYHWPVPQPPCNPRQQAVLRDFRLAAVLLECDSLACLWHESPAEWVVRSSARRKIEEAARRLLRAAELLLLAEGDEQIKTPPGALCAHAAGFATCLEMAMRDLVGTDYKALLGRSRQYRPSPESA